MPQSTAHPEPAILAGADRNRPRVRATRRSQRAIALLTSTSLVVAMTLGSYINATPQQAPLAPIPLQAAPAPMPPQAIQAVPSEQLDQMVAPIALYPDALVAKILAASAYPTQIVEADRFIQEHQGLTGAPLAQAVDQENWDPSVKALIQFPSVLASMDKNQSWTTALGVAYAQQPQDVMG